MLVNVGEDGSRKSLTGTGVAAFEVDAGVLTRAMTVVEDALVDVFTTVRGHGEPALALAQERSWPVKKFDQMPFPAFL